MAENQLDKVEQYINYQQSNHQLNVSQTVCRGVKVASDTYHSLRSASVGSS